MTLKTICILLLVSTSISFKNNIKPLYELIGHSEPVSCMDISKDGRYLASGSRAVSLLGLNGKYELIIWDLNNKLISKILNGHTSNITSLAFSKNDKILASIDNHGELYIWDIANDYKIIKKIKVSGIVNTLKFSPDGHYLIAATSYDNKRIIVWNLDSGDVVSEIPIDDEQIGSIDVSPDGSKIAIAGYKSIQILCLIGRNIVSQTSKDKSFGRCVKYSPDGKILAVSLSDGDIGIYRSTDLEQIGILKGHFKEVLSLSFSSKNDLLVSSSADYSIKLWDYSKNKEKLTIPNAHKGIVYKVIFSPERNIFFSTGEDDIIKCWEI